MSALPSMVGPGRKQGVSVSEVVVFDLETTGIGPNHRIVEIGGVIWDYESDEVVGEFETLIDPQRALDGKAKEKNGLEYSDLTSAPLFEEVAPWLVKIFDRRPVVVHNASFDIPMINREFERAGIEFQLSQVVCTYILTNKKLSLAASDVGYPLLRAGTAIEDARATLEVFRQQDFRRAINGANRAQHVAPKMQIMEHRTLSRFQAGVSDEEYELETFSRHLEFEGLDPERQFLSLLDEVLEDMRIDPREQDELDKFAYELGFSAAQVRQLKSRYLSSVKTAALRDGKITHKEADLINSLSTLLGFPANVSPSNTHSEIELEQGALLCATGSPVINGKSVSKNEIRITVETAGFQFTDVLNKKSGVALLILPGESSSSGKAQKAANWGIPTIDYRTFLNRIGL